MEYKEVKYRNIPFCDRGDEYYTFNCIENLAKICEQYKNQIIKCRTLGVISSINGRFYLKDMDLPLYNSSTMLRVSMVYMRVPLKCMAMSQAVQVFGILQWENEPVIFAFVVQHLNTAMAVKLHNTIKSIAKDHLAIPSKLKLENLKIECN